MNTHCFIKLLEMNFHSNNAVFLHLMTKVEIQVNLKCVEGA